MERARRVVARYGASEVSSEPDACHLNILAALARLPDLQRRAVVLHDVADRTVAEVAAELRVPEGSVRGWLSRARAGLCRSTAYRALLRMAMPTA